jgi:hypothetical protein
MSRRRIEHSHPRQKIVEEALYPESRLAGLSEVDCNEKVTHATPGSK